MAYYYYHNHGPETGAALRLITARAWTVCDAIGRGAPRVGAVGQYSREGPKTRPAVQVGGRAWKCHATGGYNKRFLDRVQGLLLNPMAYRVPPCS